MRIRSIKPEFWRSEDIAALDWSDRLLFVGLWSYVDDNGVGRDVEKLIVADLFALEEDPRETLATVSRGLQNLADAGLVTRYDVEERPFLHIATWEDHQRIDKPNKPRYPLPTCDDARPRGTVAAPSRQSRETPAPGAVEQWSSGAEEQGSSGQASSPAAPARARAATRFAEFWTLYPRKVGKDDAEKAYRSALKPTTEDVLLDGVRRLAADPNLPAKKFIPHAATWLNRGGWDDEPYPAQVAVGTGGPGQKRMENLRGLLERARAEDEAIGGAA